MKFKTLIRNQTSSMCNFLQKFYFIKKIILKSLKSKSKNLRIIDKNKGTK